MNPTKYEKFKITYNEYGTLLGKLYSKIIDYTNDFDVVYGFPRGGLPIAVHFAHMFDAKLVLDIRDLYGVVENNKSILIIDDIADTGDTLLYGIPDIIRNHEKTIVSTIFYKKRSKFFPHCYAEKIHDNKWIVFPWENDEEVPNR